ncbi:MAG: ABC transporter permease [Candidatus Nanopelagicales bacterium]
MSLHSYAVSDTARLTQRILKHNIRSIDTVMTVLFTPIMILLAFVFVIGGAITVPGITYVDYIMPVILLMTIASGVAYTAFRVNNDINSGMYARLQTLPIARASILGGHVVASVVINAISVALVFAFGLLVGYRPHADLSGWLATVGLLLLTLIAFTTIGVTFGLIAKSTEGSSLFSYLLLGLLFVSSGFAPTATMPTGLRIFANHQPMTPLLDALRSAQLGQPINANLWIAAAWLTAMTIGFALLAHATSNRTPKATP